MLALAADERQRHSLYEGLYREFLHHEHRFYDKLLVDPGHRGRLDPESLFVVKGIGDEIWMFYEPPAGSTPHLVTAAVRLLEAGLALVAEHVSWQGTERHSDAGTTLQDEESQRFDGMQLAYKMHMDLIQDAIEISDIRADYIAGNVGAYLSRSGAPFDADMAALEPLERRLGGDRRQAAEALDPDRLHRSRGGPVLPDDEGGLPGIVSMGEALFDAMGFSTDLKVPPGLFEASITWDRNPDAPGNGLGVSGLLFTKEVLPAATLKGIGYDYAVYRFATRPQLNQLWHRALREDLINPVLAVFPREPAHALSRTRGTAAGDEQADRSGE